jgi:hypothetical protein
MLGGVASSVVRKDSALIDASSRAVAARRSVLLSSSDSRLIRASNAATVVPVQMSVPSPTVATRSPMIP